MRTSDDVREVVALALKKPAIAPPGKKLRDYRRGGERTEENVYSRWVIGWCFFMSNIFVVMKPGAAAETDVCSVK